MDNGKIKIGVIQVANEEKGEVTELALAAALTALGCKLHPPYAGGRFIRGKRVYKAVYFVPDERTRRLVKLWHSEFAGGEEKPLTEDQERLVIRFMKAAFANWQVIFDKIDKGRDMAVINQGDGRSLLMPVKLRREQRP